MRGLLGPNTLRAVSGAGTHAEGPPFDESNGGP